MTKGSTRSRHDESCGVGFLFLSFFFLISFSTDALPLAASTECISISRPPRKYRYFNESVCYYSRLASTSSRRSVYSKIHRRETSGVASNGAPLSEATIFLKIPYPKGVWNSLNPRYSPGEGVSLSLRPPTSFSTLSLSSTRVLSYLERGSTPSQCFHPRIFAFSLVHPEGFAHAPFEFIVRPENFGCSTRSRVPWSIDKQSNRRAQIRK